MPAKKATAAPGMSKLREKLVKNYGSQVTRQDSEPQQYEVIPTGSLALDYATVVGGYIRGRIHLLWGPEGSGKTTEACRAMGNAQRLHPDSEVVYIDMEQTFDFAWARKNGLDVSESRFIHLFPDNSEDVADMLKDACEYGAVMVVVDSVGGMVTKAAIDKNADASNMGKNAQIVTRMCQICAVKARQNKTCVIIISQVRAQMGTGGGGKSLPDTYAAPKALRHHTTMVIGFRPNGSPLTATIDGDSIPVARPVMARVERSKVAPGGRKAEMTIINVGTTLYGPVGVDQADEAFTIATKPSINAIVQTGGWYTLPDGRKLNGQDKVIEVLRSEPELLTEVRTRALASLEKLIQPESPELEFIPGDLTEEMEAAEAQAAS